MRAFTPSDGATSWSCELLDCNQVACFHQAPHGRGSSSLLQQVTWRWQAASSSLLQAVVVLDSLGLSDVCGDSPAANERKSVVDKALQAAFKGYDSCSVPLLSLVEVLVQAAGGAACFCQALFKALPTCYIDPVSLCCRRRTVRTSLASCAPYAHQHGCFAMHGHMPCHSTLRSTNAVAQSAPCTRAIGR